jgi:hypothetical protein
MFEALMRRLPVARAPSVSIRQPIDSEGTAEIAWEALVCETKSKFIEYEEARQIVNRASFFVQQYGAFMNVRFMVMPDPSIPESAAFEVVRAFLLELERRCASDSEKFGCIAQLERDEGDVVGRVVAHAPVTLLDGSAQDSPVQNWDNWARQHGCLVETHVAPNGEAYRFHWHSVLTLVAGFDLPSSQLREELEISRQLWRHPGPLDCPRLVFSPRLSEKGLGSVSVNGMSFSSAFDAKAWADVKTGWEMKEYADRAEEAERRTRALSDLQASFKGQPEELRLACERLQADWCFVGAEGRTRSYIGWWHA